MTKNAAVSFISTAPLSLARSTMASDAVQSALLSKLEASLTSHSSEDIHSLFSDHLRPFLDLAAAAKPRKSSKSGGGGSGGQQQSSIRSLAKQYLSFLNRPLSLLPKLLLAPRPDQSRLFESYGLLRYVHCFKSCGLYADAASEGFTLLESLRGIVFGGGGGRARGKGGFLPPVVKQVSEDGGFAVLVVEMVVTIVKRVAMGQSKDAGNYSKVLALVDEVRLWFGVLDANAHDKLRRALVAYLGKYEIFKFACGICSILMSLSGRRTSLIFDVLTCLLESSGRDAKIEKATKKVSMPVSLILKLYALGLYILDAKVKPKDGGGLAEDDRVGGLLVAVDDVGRGRGGPLEEVLVEHVVDVDPLLAPPTTTSLPSTGGGAAAPSGSVASRAPEAMGEEELREEARG
ncbi:hypothetical protein NL676_013422 [Syzygium grande]|nr:hypothetical protein NL676_013422 [Syzygium grande]